MKREARAFDPLVVEPGQDATVVARCSNRGGVFVPRTYVVPDDVAPHFSVLELLVGESSQSVAATSMVALSGSGGGDRIRYASSGSLPAALFGRSSPLGGGLLCLAHDGVTSRTGVEGRVCMRVRNVSQERREFRGSVVGVRSEGYLETGHGIALGLGRSPSSRGQRTRVCAGSAVCFRPTHLYFPPDVFGVVALERVTVVSPEGLLAGEVARWRVSRGLVELEGDLVVCPSQHVVVDFLQTADRFVTVEGAVVGVLAGPVAGVVTRRGLSSQELSR